jgi:hypothetical protein
VRQLALELLLRITHKAFYVGLTCLFVRYCTLTNGSAVRKYSFRITKFSAGAFDWTIGAQDRLSPAFEPPIFPGLLIRGLDALQQVEANFQGRRFPFRSQLTADASQAVRATGVAIPPTLRELQ